MVQGHFLRRPSANAAPNSSRVCSTPRKCSDGAFSYAWPGRSTISSTSRSSLRKSSTRARSSASPWVKKGCVGGHPETSRLCGLDRRTALSNTARARPQASRDARAVHPCEPPEDIRAGLKFSSFFSSSSALVQTVDKPLALDQFRGDHGLRMDQWLAAAIETIADRFPDRADRLLDRHAPPQLMLGVLDLAQPEHEGRALEGAARARRSAETFPRFGQPLAHEVRAPYACPA